MLELMFAPLQKRMWSWRKKRRREKKDKRESNRRVKINAVGRDLC